MIIHGEAIAEMQKLPSGSIDMIMTDPPYGHSNNTKHDLIARREKALGTIAKNEDPRPILNDGIEATQLFQDFLVEANRVLMPGSACCVCCGGGGGGDMQYVKWSQWMADIFNFKMAVVWDKGKIGMGWHYRRSYEFILVATKKGAKDRWYATEHNIENIIRPGMYGIKKIIPGKKYHPTAKPTKLGEFFIKNHTQPGELVLDPFCGGGAFLLASKNLGRRFLGIELDEYWAEESKKLVEIAE
jgi:DNA modification methylase